MQEGIRKMITEAMAARHADVKQGKMKRGQNFVIGDTKACFDAVWDMKPAGDLSKAVFALHTDSVNARYTIVKGLAPMIRPDDNPFVGYHRTPVIMERLSDA